MPFAVKKIRRVNPPKKAGKAKAKRKKNPPAVLIGLGNPRGNTMKKAKDCKSTPRRNPPKRKAGARRNPPSPAKLAGRSFSLLRQGVMALVGLLITRQLPQLVLGQRNAGYIGNVANILAAIAAGVAVSKFVSKADGAAAMIGGGLYTVTRIVDEHTPLGRALQLSGVGDPVAAGSLRGVRETYQPMPVQRNSDGSFYIPREIISAARPPLPAGAALGCVDARYRFAA